VNSNLNPFLSVSAPVKLALTNDFRGYTDKIEFDPDKWVLSEKTAIN
jgi:hypothetical protein